MIHNRYSEILAEIKDTAQKSGRNPDDITLIAVSKTRSWEKVSFCYLEGCRNFGESRVPEAIAKQEIAPKDIEWHFIGPLQKNKVRKVVGRFFLIHSVDSISLAEKISEVSLEIGVKTSILIQVNTSGELSKQGFAKNEFGAALEQIKSLPGINVKGLMTMAPLTQDEDRIRSCFRDLKALQNKYASNDLPLKELSMGMSEDFHIAIQEGATYLRLGSILFGERK